ncbi:glyoxylate reductase/hydroxypyruvate reductase-like protein [Plakobranchus ocellatus]|uniref:Glyoxylate reductase/hydroxypyruvate reductase n=1 Tax=Plakobranchus ocellatus TaxID=259542 RepID=A0AAV3YHB9_9GAST|nr:glyoxylate reductase/hydroxypyruvate reductase-like protein [Plakobranchus ocellatus]
MSLPKVFISRKIPEKARTLIASLCDAVLWNKDEPPLREEYLQKVKGINGLFCLLTDKIDAELLDAAGPDLKVVSTMSVGYDHIDVKECAKRNILVGYTPGILTKATAELTVALLLATSRRLKEGMQAVENGKWGTWKPMWMCGQGLDEATVGIVGMGRIGHTVAHCLKPFGVAKFLYSGRTQKPEAEAELNAEFVDLDQLLSQSDFVIACCALTPQTAGMFNASAFQKMKKTAVFVNSSRGNIVNQEDLLVALESGEIGAAGLDVTVPEPLPTDSPLLKLSNCVVLPHIGSATFDTREAMAVLAAQNLIAGLKGEKLPCQIHS